MNIFPAGKFSYDVYDGINMKGVTINPNVITTVMCAFPFTVLAQKSGAENGVTARLTGFENVRNDNVDQCPLAFISPTQYPFGGFTLTVAGPIISLLFNERNPVQVDAIRDFSMNTIAPLFDLSAQGFITSGGYNRCRKPNAGKIANDESFNNTHSGGIQSFRTVYLETSPTYTIDSILNEYNVTIDVDPNLDENHKLTINDRQNKHIETLVNLSAEIIQKSKIQGH
ncbi:hypothetical protein PENTCL1PPCAC_21548, partial [Pristionchus entomophagus]